MRSTFSGLNTMVRGIFSNQVSLDTVGHNITNASTEGYSRQGVNLAATRGQLQSSIYGEVLVGTGVDSMSIERARNFYADLQYWDEAATKKYYETMQVNYDKVEVIFNDSDESGIQNAMEQFYASWVNLSKDSTDSAARVAVVEKGKVYSDTVRTAARLLSDQITAEYDDMRLTLAKFNDLGAQVAKLNKSITLMEASGATANDLRDERDLIVDRMSDYLNLTVHEDDKGRYTVVSNGITLVQGESQMEIKMSDPVPNRQYGVFESNLVIASTGLVFQPSNGYFKAKLDSIEVDKGYIDDLACMAAQLLTAFNDQHRVGVGIDNASTTGMNFFGQNTGPEGQTFTDKDDSSITHTCNMTLYTWDEEAKALVMTAAEKTVTTTDKDGIANTSAVVDGNVTVEYTMTTDMDQVTVKKGLEIIEELKVASDFTEVGGQNKVAARAATTVETEGTSMLDTTKVVSGYSQKMTGANLTLTKSELTSMNGTRDGSNAVLLSNFFNVIQANYESSTNAVVYKDASGNIQHQTYATNITAGEGFPLNEFYGQSMSHLANESQAMDTKADEQDDIMTQIIAWRSSTSGVDWNEELTNMLMFQKGYSACSRCLTTMDEMLDRLINSTGMVGR